MKVCPLCDACINDNEIVSYDGEFMCFVCRDELFDKAEMRKEEQKQYFEFLQEEE